MKSHVVIQGSARIDGNTSKIIEYLKELLPTDVVHLQSKSIGYFDYNFNNQDDDFLPLFRSIVNNYDTLIFATPVYWYSMSGLMKSFFDRITDCLKIEKDTGRKLRGKNMAAISCGSDNIETEGFFVPFRNSADYLGMNYLGDVHTWMDSDEIREEVKQRIELFVKTVKYP